MRRILLAATGLAALFAVFAPRALPDGEPVPPAAAAEPPARPRMSPQTEECITCHQSVTPGIVADWLASRHARTTPETALRAEPLARRISVAAADALPEPLRKVAVGCFECHGQAPESHPDTVEHADFKIHPVVTPNDCKTCHPVEVEQFAGSKMAHAHDNLAKNPLFHSLSETLTAGAEVKGGALHVLPPADATRLDTCYGCHGTAVTVSGKRTVSTDLGDFELPVLTGWPNQGVGRINPDGSRGSCAACHTRHEFSLEVARKPFTCGQCHLEPDTPAFEVWQESKHGNLVLSQQQGYTWDAVPWTVGTDFRAPTCAACHASLLVSPGGETIAERTHDYGSRLWVRLFGLPYAHPQPKSGATHEIRNADGQPLPTTFAGAPATSFLISEKEAKRRRAGMTKICAACHGSSVPLAHFAKLDGTIAETNRMTLAATQLVEQAWARGLADRSNPFDEPIERKWMRQWLFYANSVRYGSAMGGPDYATFRNGWFGLTENLREMEEWLALRRKPADGK
ncbi:MAG: hydroxylamine oxidase [Planctomycetes bacterium]|nr:hydroxylamine oxidase [Planctomycetota bacterium]